MSQSTFQRHLPSSPRAPTVQPAPLCLSPLRSSPHLTFTEAGMLEHRITTSSIPPCSCAIWPSLLIENISKIVSTNFFALSHLHIGFLPKPTLSPVQGSVSVIEFNLLLISMYQITEAHSPKQCPKHRWSRQKPWLDLNSQYCPHF